MIFDEPLDKILDLDSWEQYAGFSSMKGPVCAYCGAPLIGVSAAKDFRQVYCEVCGEISAVKKTDFHGRELWHSLRRAKKAT